MLDSISCLYAAANRSNVTGILTVTKPFRIDRSLRRTMASLLGFSSMITMLPPAAVAQQSDHAAKPAAAASRAEYAATPLSFVRNAGQDPSQAQYLAHGPGYAMRLASGSVELSLLHGAKTHAADGKAAPSDPARLGMTFAGANPSATLETSEPLPGIESYFTGPDEKNWHTGLPTYARLRYRALYPGIDLAFHSSANLAGSSRESGKLEYDIELAPHADARAIAITLEHAERAAIEKDGSLQLSVAGSSLRFLKPVAWQGGQNGTARKPVEVSYSLQAAKEGTPAVLSFVMGNYNHDQPLVIDPVLDYATYLNLYSETAMTVDSSGNVYVTGQDPSNSSYAFDVLKFNSAGKLLYTAVVQNASSSSYGYSSAIAVDSSGEAYVAGFAGYGWPATSTAYQAANGYASQSNPYYYNAYLVKLNAAGSAMAYASYLGGSNASLPYTDYATALALDSSGNAYLTGQTSSPNFPTTTGAFQTAFPANGNSSTAFVAKFNPTLSGAKSLIYSTLLGDQNTFESSIAVDASGNAYLAGYASNQYNSTLAATSGAFAYNGVQSSGGAGTYVTKLNPAGSALVYSAYLGYVGPGNGYGVAVDGSGDAYVTGPVGVEDFPTTLGAYQTSYPSGFAVELNPTGTAEIYSTFLSGPSGATSSPMYPHTMAIAPGCSSACAAYIAGTSSSGTDLPQINSIQTVPGDGGYYSGFLVALNGTGSAATLSTYIGGLTSYNDAIEPSYTTYLEQTPSVAVDSAGDIYYSAIMTSPDFPVTTTAAAVGSYYPYLAKIGPAAGAQLVAVPNTTVNLGNSVLGTSSAVYATPSAITVRNVGSVAATISSITPSSSVFTQTNTCGGTVAAGGQCTLTPAFTPTADGAVNGTLSIASNSVSSPLAISLTGNGIDGGYLQGSPNALNFGTQTVGTASAVQVVTLRNTGNQSLTSLTLNNLPAGFTSLNDCPATLNAGQSCQYGFQFAPYQAGYATDNSSLYIQAYSSGYGYSNVPVSLKGTGVISGDTGVLTLNPTALNFNTLAVGTASTNQFVTISNTGTVPVTVTGYPVALTSSVGSAADFVVNPYSCGAPPFVIQPQSTCSLYITFTPSAAGAETAKLTIANSSSTSNTVALSGTGSADTQTLVFTPSNFVFTDQAVGTTGNNVSFYVANTGDYPVLVDRVYATGDFHLTYAGCAGTTVTPAAEPGTLGGYCYVNVVFTPTATGNRTGTIVFIDTAGGTQTLSLSGNGITPTGSLVVDPATLAFPAQAVGTSSATQSFTVSNPGNSPVTVNSITTTGDYSFTQGYFYNCGSTLPCTLPAGTTYPSTGSITFTPTATGTRTGTVTINSTAGVQKITLTGTGETASVAVALTPAIGSTLSFGSVQSGASNYANVYLRNVGTEPVTIPSLPTVSGNYSLYPYSGNSCGYNVTTLQPGADCVVYLAFSPATTGTQTGVLTITDSASTQTLNLSGSGTAAAPTTYFQPATFTSPETPVGAVTSGSYNPYVGSTQYFYYNGSGSLTIASASVTAGGSSFNLPLFGDNCTGTTISSGSYCTIEVSFAPTAAGYDTGTVTLTDTNNVKYTLPLAGYAPVISDTGYLSPEALTFTSQTVGTTSAAQTITLNNTGSTNMTVGTVGGTNLGPNSEFMLQSDSCSNVAVTSISGTCSVNIQFSPSASGARTGQLSIPVTYSDSTTATFTANLTGTGAAAANKAVLSPTTSQYPDTVIGTSFGGSYNQSFTLYNVGSLSLNVGQLTGTNTVVGTTRSGDYMASDGCSGVAVAAGSSCSVTVNFAPLAGATGARTGSITFPVVYSGASTVTPFTASFTGNAVSISKSLSVSPSNAQLGAWTIGVTSTATVLTLTNTGNTSLTLGTPTIAAPFGLQNYCGTSLAANGSCSIYVKFRPSAAGAVTGTLSIPNGAGSAVTVPIYGTGLSASQQLVWSQTTAAFGNQLVGTTSHQVTLSLLNQSTASVPIKLVSLGGTNSGDFAVVSDACTGTTLTTQTLCSVVLDFSPRSTSTGSRTATLTETDNGTGSPRSVSLSGTGINPTPSVGLFPASLTFGTQNIGTKSGSQVFSVTNTGSGSLKVTTVASTGSSEFAIASNACNGVTLAAGTDCLVSVTWSPTSGGTHTGTISVTDNATGSPQTVALTGLVPQASLSVTSLSFGNQTVGTSSAAQTATLTNGGTGTLGIASIALGGSGATDFTSTNTCGTSLGAGASCTISTIFAPKAAGSLTATITITDNAALVAGTTQTISLSGTGIPVAATPTFTPVAGTYATTQSVTIADTTSGASIYYTTNGTTPTTSSTKYTAAISVSANETIEAIAVATGYAQSATATAIYAIQAAAPTFTPVAGTYTSTQSVTMADTTSGATINYTTNGTTPTTSSTKYTAPISVSATETIEAIAVATGYAQSPTATAKYTITPPAATPTFTPVAGTYTSTQSVTIADTTSGATIYYTTNGTTPTTSSTKYTAPISVSATETIEAIAVATGYIQSATATATYTITPPAATPIFTPVAGTYTSTQSVTIADTTSGATIYYTTNGTTPTTSSTKYNAAISVSATETIEAIAVATGYTQSATATATYTIKPAAARPTFSRPASASVTTKSVTIVDATSGAAIFYTTDGSTPTAASTRYTRPIQVTNAETIKAVVTGTGYSLSPVATMTVRP